MQKRLKLIHMVITLNVGVTKAARKLRIKIPTAKVILSSYRKKGLIFHKKNDNRPVPEALLPPEALPEAVKEPDVPEATVESVPAMWYYPTFYILPYQNPGCMINF